jgi:hypothetical protein
MNNRLIVGIAAILLGVVVLVWPNFLGIIVGLLLICFGLWYTLQNAGTGSNL